MIEKMSASKSAFEKDRQWFVDTFAKASQLESRLIPDVLDGKEGPAREVRFPFAAGKNKDLKVATAFGLTLSVWTGDTKACFGFADGESPECPVYLEWTPDQPTKELLDGVTKQAEGAREHGAYPYADGADELELDRSMRLEGPAKEAAKELPDGVDALFQWSEDQMTILYRPEKYSEGILKQFTDSLAACLHSLEKAKTVQDLVFASDEQVAEVEGFNPGPVDFDLDKTLVDLFRENVAAHPDNLAIAYKGTLLTYAQLDELSDRLAAHVEGIVKPGGVVSIIIGRNEYMGIAPLAVLKAGCAYQPLDPSYPSERLSFMVQDSKAALLIADPGLETLVTGYEGPVLSTGEIPLLPEGKPSVAAPKPDDRFILLYTSGTTGVPKGVQLSHRNIATFARSSGRSLGVSAESNTAAYASFGFDASMADFSTAMASGASLFIIPDEIRLDLAALNDFFEQNGITHVMMTTQVATQFALNFPDNKSLQVLYTGGEKLSSFAPPKYRLVNAYGPTETTAYVLSKDVREQVPDVPIGKPLTGIRAYVVGKGGQRLGAVCLICGRIGRSAVEKDDVSPRQTSFAVERCVIRGIPFRYEILLNGLSLSDRAADDLLDTSSVNIDTWA